MTLRWFAWFAACVPLGAAADAPVASVQPWTPMGVSSELFESHPAFDPKTGELYFVRSSKSFSGWRILHSHCEGARWSEPTDAPFAGPGTEADPWFTPDGRSVYFISTRATGSLKSKDLDIWRADRAADGHWNAPVRLPAPVNSDQAEWFPRLGTDGWLYFGSNRPGGFGKNDIWRARETTPGQWVVENAGPAINTAGDEYEPLPSPDGKRLIVEADGGLYQSLRGPKGWLPRTKLGPAINVNGSEIGALFSPSGKTLLFARDTGEPKSGEFFVWHIEGNESWPPSCGGTSVKP
ncbi:PD40 domain-containing protein [Dyella sp. AtDHG13]|uniref:PD40 domain-containing protein n=1 Tax=Dyella sp. AtDHG13 TaxID=1938897 RepID=UPI0009427ECC|nr:PD40 domain-containing protein [Dyella sp. AtDHG13]